MHQTCAPSAPAALPKCGAYHGRVNPAVCDTVGAVSAKAWFQRSTVAPIAERLHRGRHPRLRLEAVACIGAKKVSTARQKNCGAVSLYLMKALGVVSSSGAIQDSSSDVILERYCGRIIFQTRNLGLVVPLSGILDRGRVGRLAVLWVVRAALRKGAPEGSWLQRMLARKPKMLVAIALANKMARSVWAMLAKGEDFRVPTVAAI